MRELKRKESPRTRKKIDESLIKNPRLTWRRLYVKKRLLLLMKGFKWE